MSQCSSCSPPPAPQHVLNCVSTHARAHVQNMSVRVGHIWSCFCAEKRQKSMLNCGPRTVQLSTLQHNWLLCLTTEFSSVLTQPGPLDTKHSPCSATFRLKEEIITHIWVYGHVKSLNLWIFLDLHFIL